jgi:hypothetical protein
MSTVVKISEAVSLAFHGMRMASGAGKGMSVKDHGAARALPRPIWRGLQSLVKEGLGFPPEVPGEASPSPDLRGRSRCFRSTWPWRSSPGGTPACSSVPSVLSEAASSRALADLTRQFVGDMQERHLRT